MTQQKPDLYAVLGLNKTATVEQIETAAKMIILTCHPDRVKNLPEAERKQKEQRYKDAVLAKDILTDSTKRASYDSGGHPALERLANGGSGFSQSRPAGDAGSQPRAPARASSFSDMMDFLARQGRPVNTRTSTPTRPQPVVPNPTEKIDLKRQGLPVPGEDSGVPAPAAITDVQAPLARAKAVLDSGTAVPLDVLAALRQNLSDALAATDRRIAAAKPQPPRPPAP
jgi:curved DNA-binding protein CbpA